MKKLELCGSGDLKIVHISSSNSYKSSQIKGNIQINCQFITKKKSNFHQISAKCPVYGLR